jgi:hypothetical protein
MQSIQTADKGSIAEDLVLEWRPDGWPLVFTDLAGGTDEDGPFEYETGLEKGRAFAEAYGLELIAEARAS